MVSAIFEFHGAGAHSGRNSAITNMTYDPYNRWGNQVASPGKNQSATNIASWISTNGIIPR
jgi:hypothetical protein